MVTTQHGARRAAQRNLSEDDIHYITTYGQRFHRAGALIYYLRRRDLPEWDRAAAQWARLAGSAVICTPDGRTLLTVWRNGQGGLKRIRRKTPYTHTPAARQPQWEEEWT